MHDLRREAGKLVQGRTRHCGRRPILGDVTVFVGAAAGAPHAQFGGLETCGSVWSCPVCAARISERRRIEIAAAMAAHKALGGAAYMATFSIPHHAMQSARELRETVAGAWRKLVAGAPWQRLQAAYGIAGYIRALETTHGANGWHPHVHVLLLTELELDGHAVADLRADLFERWAAKVEAMGMGKCSPRAFDLARADDEAASYVGKWGADSELARAHLKTSRKGGRTPWQILSDYLDHGRPRDAALFREYAEAFKGARQLTWSKGLKARFGVEEKSDEEAAAGDAAPSEAVAVIDNRTWRDVVWCGLTAAVLDVAQDGGFAAVRLLLEGNGIAVEGVTKPVVREPGPGNRGGADGAAAATTGASG